MKKRKIIIISVGSVLVVGGVLAVVGFILLRNQQTRQKNAEQVLTQVLETGCDNANIENMEKAYSEISNVDKRADAASTIAQCASVGFKDMTRAVKWSKVAAEDYASAGDSAKAKQYSDYAAQYEPYLNGVQSEAVTTEEKGAD